ncbi:hypothetical protein AtEden1_Chr2g0233361 [Arabidopsis thaliana]
MIGQSSSSTMKVVILHSFFEFELLVLNHNSIISRFILKRNKKQLKFLIDSNYIRLESLGSLYSFP